MKSITLKQIADLIQETTLAQSLIRDEWEVIIPNGFYEDVLALPEFKHSDIEITGALITERKAPTHIFGYAIRFADVDKMTFAKIEGLI